MQQASLLQDAQPVMAELNMECQLMYQMRKFLHTQLGLTQDSVKNRHMLALTRMTQFCRIIWWKRIKMC